MNWWRLEYAILAVVASHGLVWWSLHRRISKNYRNIFRVNDKVETARKIADQSLIKGKFTDQNLELLREAVGTLERATTAVQACNAGEDEMQRFVLRLGDLEDDLLGTRHLFESVLQTLNAAGTADQAVKAMELAASTALKLEELHASLRLIVSKRL